jgi:hypothetical protein
MRPVTEYQKLWLPVELHEPFRAIADANGHPMTRLVWCWLWAGVKSAMAGRPLPSALSAPPAPKYRSREIRWSQRKVEYDRWSQVLRDNNSSPAAVIQAEIRAYIEADGDAAGVGAPLADLIYA